MEVRVQGYKLSIGYACRVFLKPPLKDTESSSKKGVVSTILAPKRYTTRVFEAVHQTCRCAFFSL